MAAQAWLRERIADRQASSAGNQAMDKESADPYIFSISIFLARMNVVLAGSY
jgi:hypothetical protein